MRMGDVWAQALRPLWSYRLRTVLSVLGIAIGVAAVVTLIMLMRSAATSVDSRVQSLGSNLVVTIINPPVRRVRHIPELSLAQARRFSHAPGISLSAPVDFQTGLVAYRARQVGVSIYGTTSAFFPVMRYRLAFGRYLTALDISHHLHVVDLGAETSQRLFGRVDPVGRTVYLNAQPYTVIGVLAAKGAMLGMNQDTVAVTPVTTYQDQNGIRTIGFIYSSASSSALVPVAVHSLQTGLKAHFQDSNRYSILTQAQILGTANKVSQLLTQVLVGVAAISVVVGGIGMMNVLTMSVSERIKEIGIRKSLGARKIDILRQFLLEAIIMAAIGAGLGVGLGLGTGFWITHYMGIGVQIEWLAVAFTFAATLGLGGIFGIYPAHRASRLNPAEALRHE